jgi:CHAT domain-containing protein/Tfp pilus assembly protein PilF
MLAPAQSLEWQKLNEEVAALYQKGQYNRAIALAKSALDIAEKETIRHPPTIATSLNSLALLYNSQGDYTLSEELYKRSLAIFEKALGPEHLDVARSLNNLALLYNDQGQYEKAEPLLQRSLAIREKALGPDHADTAAGLNSLAELYRNRAQYAQAEPLLKRSLAIWEKTLGLDHPNVAANLNNLAALYKSQGRYEKAELLFKRALAIKEKALGPDHPDVALTLNHLAELYSNQGQYEKAELLFKRTLAILEKTLGPGHPYVAFSLNNLGNLYSNQGRYAQAEPLYKHSLAIEEKAFGPEHPDVAVSLNNLGDLYSKQGQYERAEPRYQLSLAIWEKILGPDHPHVALSLHNLAGLYKDQGQYEKAEPLYKRSLAILEKVLGLDHPYVAMSLTNLSINARARGEMARSVEFFGRANAIREHHLRLLLTKGSEYEKRAYMTTINSDIDVRISLDQGSAARVAGSARLALTTLLQRKGRVLDALADSFGDLRRRLSPEDTTLLDQLSSVNAQRATMYLHATQAKIAPEQYHREMARLEEEAQALEARISASSAEFRALAQPITLEGVQQAIPSGAALVEFAVYRPFDPKAKTLGERWGPARYVAYVLRPEGDPVSVDVGEARIIGRLVGDLRQGLANPSSQFVTRIGRKLDEQIMLPVRRLLGETRTVLLSPDGALNLVPFGALVDEENQYLMKRYAFTYLSSGRDLLRLQAKVTSRYPGTIMAEVDFGSPREALQAAQTEPGGAKKRSMDFAAGGFLPLPGTAAEAQAIAKIFPTLKILSGKQATESALKQLHGPQILHVATHGFFLPIVREESLEKSDLQLAGVSSMQVPKTENPLLRSGLALANANQLESETEDGVLTALEAAGLDLWGTKLVVLSACETGVGEVQNGEGVFGLRRSLMIAGSESQVMSLWKVDDHATKDLMVDYYTHLISNKGRSEALRQAQLAMLNSKKYKHPFYWASFIPSGNWSQLERSVPEDQLQ